jgi:hypothetical protein
MEQLTMPATEVSFRDFLLKNPRNRLIITLAAIAIVIQFVVFKYLYPFASFIHGDSFSYLDAANDNLTINTYLIGYSKFLRLLNLFAKPDLALVIFQYLFIQSAVLLLIFTLFYFYKTTRLIQWIIVVFMVGNPLFLHLANLVSSDGFFLALSCCWFALLLWIIHKPSTKIIIWHGVVLFLCFTVRYNSLIYPLLSILAFWMSRMTIRKKIIGFAFGLALCGWFVGVTMYQYKRLTGYWQYSPFSGWQMANNAMYAYRYVDSADRKPVLQQYQALDNMIRKFYDMTRNVTYYPSEKAMASTFYMWTPGMPLMNYRDSIFKAKAPKAVEFKKWASMGPLYRSYGLYIIKKYPLYYVSYFLWPNAGKYYAPPVEFLESYNSGRRAVTDQAKQWFGYKTRFVKTRMKNPDSWVLNFYPILSGIINCLMFFGLFYYLLLKGWKQNISFHKTIIMGGILWLLNAVFTITASSAALRFQSFPIILTTTYTLIIIDWMVQLVRKMNLEKNRLSKIKEYPSQEALA